MHRSIIQLLLYVCIAIALNMCIMYSHGIKTKSQKHSYIAMYVGSRKCIIIYVAIGQVLCCSQIKMITL